ncbi:glutamine synthetase family protein [Gammaproteobacteria bacterium]|nr:glutamine synthetase family protein [Gammaproteobacteria bacterium]
MSQWIRDKRITEIECLVPDITGNARGKIMPAGKFVKDPVMRMPETIFMQTVTGDWVGYDEGPAPIEVDMFTRPDPDTLRLVPWTEEPTAQAIFDCYDHNGEEIELAPRSVLKRVLAAYADAGLKPVVAPELEFYLVKRNPDPDYPLEPPVGRSGRREVGSQAYSIDGVNEFDPLFEDVYDYCEAQELDIDTVIHESGAGQMEMNFEHGDALYLADQVFLFKRTVREAALRHDMYATFMAKPHEQEPGSAMHIHQSLVDSQTGKSVFVNADGSYSELFLQFIAGQQHYLPLGTALFAPNVNSYRRFAPDEAAPINTAWGIDNRTVGLRVPWADAQATRVENRLPGADANPYLVLAVSLAAGLLGIQEKLAASEKMEGSAYSLPFNIPRNLMDALQHLRDCDPLRELLGKRFVDNYCDVKNNEYNTFFQVISSWEREYLLLNV